MTVIIAVLQRCEENVINQAKGAGLGNILVTRQDEENCLCGNGGEMESQPSGIGGFILRTGANNVRFRV